MRSREEGRRGSTTLAALLLAQARRQPEALAVLAPGRGTLTYAGLLAQAQHLAAHLRAAGAQPSTRVAVLLPNGPEMAVAFLAVAAGAACAPLNPAYQAEELRFHLQDTGAQMLLLRRDDRGPARDVAWELGLTLIEIDVDDEAPAGCFRIAGDGAMPPGARHVADGAPRSLADVAGSPADIALLLHTSGTTARPKLVPLSQANLMASAHNIAAHLALSPADRCLSVMPLFHIHGLVGALLATLAGGGSIVCTPGFDGHAYFDWVAQFEPSWTTAVPTIHQALLAHGAAYREKAPQHRFRFVRSSSAALPAATLRQLQALLQAPVVEAYGMTEASHQMASNPLGAGLQTPGSVGVAAGARIAILDAAGRPLRIGEPGEIAIRGPGVMRGYENNPQANAEAFRDGWFRTGDLGHVDAQGRLFIAGRLKEIVNRGGEKVSPREVDEALLDHPGVLQASAFGVPHVSLGEDLAAAVVRRAGTSIDEAALREFLFARLAAFKVPSQIVFVHAIPAGATGKVQRGALHRLLGASLAREHVAPDSAAEQALAAIFAEVLECDAVGLHDNFFARGGDSLRGARVVARINQRFGVRLAATSLFRHPSVAELAALLQAGGATGAAVADALGEAAVPAPMLPPSAVLAGAGAAPGAAATATATASGNAVPCSYAQEALWLVERLLGGSGVYNIAHAVQIDGPLDVAALERALQGLLQRHEVLRTGFDEIDGVPKPRVQADAQLQLAHVDATDLGAPDQQDTLLQRMSDAALRPFDLTTAPLLRAALWRLAPPAAPDRAEACTDADSAAPNVAAPRHVLLLVVHHTVADGWSMQVIARELEALYAALRSGERSALPPLPIQFADWASHQRATMAHERDAADLHYWRRQLAGLEPLALPTDRPRPPPPGHAGSAERFTVPPDLLRSLQALAREHDATLFMLLLAAFQVLLMRISGQDEVVVGSPVAGREQPELEGMVGCFVNSVVLRTDLAGNPSFAELLARVRQTALDAYTHQALPFDRLVAELSPQRDLSRNPLYQVSFALDNQPAPAYALAGAEVRRLPLPVRCAKFDLSLTFAEASGETPGALAGVLEYSSALFEPATAARLVAQMQTLLGAIAADPGRRVGHLPLQSEAERHRLLWAWNDTAAPEPADALHTLIERHAQRHPHATALVCGDAHLGYGELDLQANRLAHHLRRRGVGPEVIVAVCMERSLQLPVALLAVLKAGGALLPLDPELPAERLAFMLRDAAARVLLTQARLAPHLAPHLAPDPASHPPAATPALLCVDTLWPHLADEPAHAPPALPVDVPDAPAQLAYVICTSGSTGEPKGVLLEQRGWRNHVAWMQRTLRLTPQDRWLQITSLGFDAALVELFMPLQAGATLVLAAPGEQRDSARLARLIAEHAITVLQMVPSALRSLLVEPGFDGSGLRRLICGGEAMDAALAAELQQRLPNAVIGNFYGPTETSIDATHFELPRPLHGAREADDAGNTDGTRGAHAVHAPNGAHGGTIAIGRPIANTECHVLDRCLQPVPVGVVGELYIGGAGLARGYLNRPALTQQRFVAHPFRAGARLYRSGDRARRRPDGLIEYLGRADQQVKIRGQRIEPGEIEVVLKAQPGVRDAVVLLREDVPGRPRLVAYAVGHALSAGGLKAALALKLPDVMVPAAVVVLASLPTLPSGKLDRGALPAPEQRAEAAAPVAPRTPTERALGQIWQEVLRTDAVGVHDHFFELGGHSLLATQVLARLRARLGVELALRTVFERPTLEALAAEVDLALAAEVDRTLAAAAAAAACTAQAEAPHAPPPLRTLIPKIGRDGPLAVSYSQRRMWLVQTLNPQTTAYNMNFGLRLRGALHAGALAEAIDAVVQRHEAFRTRFGMLDGEVMQWIDPPRPAQIDTVDLRHLPAAEREQAALAHRERQAGRHFDLSASGLYRVGLLQMADDEHVLLWVIHHVIGDHWSDGILLSEVGEVYAARLQRRAPVLPALAVEYADYAAWQRAPARRDALAPQMAYWAQRLQGVRPLPLPHDMAPLGLPSGRGGSVSTSFPAPTFEALRHLCSRHGVTPFMALLACFKVVLARRCGQADIAVGSPVANRTRIEAEALVGTLVNTLVMRTSLAGNPSLAGLLARVRETALEAFAHQDAPFERLVEELEFERNPTRQPLVQVLFNVINAPFEVNALPGLTLQPFQYTSVAAQFELGLTIDDVFHNVHLTYSTDLFTRASAERLVTSFLTVVDQLIADPECSVRDCETMGAAERAELARWNATGVPFETGLRLGDLLRRQAQRSADAVALICDGERLTYRDLDARACALALRLRDAGVRPGTLVGVCVERSAELVVALLGVVYSGGAYVPLDPSYPAERLARMGEDAALPIVISRAAEWGRVGAALPPGLRMLEVDAPDLADAPADAGAGARGNGAAADAFELTGTPDDPAYVIFTSGSTGRPKGAINAHKGIVNRLQWMQQEYRLTGDDRVMQKTPCSFDVSVWEFFWPLITGAALVVARPDGHRDRGYLVRLIHEQRVSVLHFVPSMLHLFLEEPELAPCRSVRRVVCSGEALPAEAVERFFRRLPHSRLCNLYGPTEAAVDVTYWECRPAEPLGIVPIGRPIANTRIHVLDEQLQRQPVGVPGELYIGGVQVGLGYVSRPELTAERFIPDPFDPGARLYKTGDLARWTTHGVIEYLGRADDQVKVRGHRIELGEIEAVLSTHPGVAHCVVIVREDRPGDRRLAAYVVARGVEPADGGALGDLRAHLRGSLPEFMVPQHFVPIEHVPLLPNGKVDRHALPRPDEAAGGAAGAEDDDPPRTEAEAALAEIWRTLLGVAQVRRSDNFFDLGGHSLLAMRAVFQMEQRIGVRIELRRLVHESLAQIAATLPAPAAASGGSGAAGAPGDDEPAPPASAGLQRILHSVRRLMRH
jgi:amino acid adenylation domain-containing protein